MFHRTRPSKQYVDLTHEFAPGFPPAHFSKGLRTVDQIDPKEMILPLVVIDVHGESTTSSEDRPLRGLLMNLWR